jgi:hypothetical protein
MGEHKSDLDNVPVTDLEIEDGARELARAVWSVVLLTKNEHRARGILGKATRKQLVESITKLMRLVRGKRS